MNQDLLNWLNHEDKNSEQVNAGLLVAPVDYVTREPEYEPESQEPEHEYELLLTVQEPELEPQLEPQEQEQEPQLEPQEQEQEPQLEPQEQEQELQLEPQEPEQELQLEPQEQEQELQLEPQEQEQELQLEPQEQEQEQEPQLEPQESEQEQKHENESQELHALIGIPDDIDKNNTVTEADTLAHEIQNLKHEHVDLNKAWHEANAGLELSMNDPPPQIWLSRDDSDSEDENESDEYEHVILQQNSSVILRGTNFTQRLKNILQGRKSKAADLKRKNSEEKKHSYLSHAIVLCAIMLLFLGLSWLSLRYLQTKTPESFNARASELYEQGKYDEAMNLYQQAYNRYPEDLNFLNGIAKSAEKAGHSQTASIAWDEYRNALPKSEDSEDIEAPKEHEALEININTGGDKKTEPKEQELTFDEYLTEANRSFNIRMYNRALRNFFNALELRKDDIRPYIGIAESYRVKGMYFDAKRILDEARARFGINPSIEAAKEFLKGSN